MYLCAQMLRLTKLITRTLSVRISLMVVCAIAVLLAAALTIVLLFARKALKEEAKQKAEQTLECTVQRIDNILLSVEQSTGNIYCSLLGNLNQPKERMFTYCRKLVETNPYIVGAAIAFEPGNDTAHGDNFMAYVHCAYTNSLKTGDLIESTSYGETPYTEQAWYAEPLKAMHPCWINPQKDLGAGKGTLITFSLPFYNIKGQHVGLLAADVSLALLSKVVLSAKPSPNSYAVLLASDGAFIVHPDSNKLFHQTVYKQMEQDSDPTVKKAIFAMMSGQTGYKHIWLGGLDRYVFYKPFTRANVPGRSMDNLSWSAGIIYPEDDIFGDFNRLLYTVIAIAILGLLLLLVLCQAFCHFQLLPLRLLTKSAQRIAEGHYDEPVPGSTHQDDVGRLQDHFQHMQLALSSNVSELERLTATLQERGEVLSQAYEQAKEADRMKTAFLHNMSNQMSPPVSVITKDVTTLSQHCHTIGKADASRLVDEIQQQGKVITDLLNDLLGRSEK